MKVVIRLMKVIGFLGGGKISYLLLSNDFYFCGFLFWDNKSIVILVIVFVIWDSILLRIFG